MSHGVGHGGSPHVSHVARMVGHGGWFVSHWTVPKCPTG